MAIRYKVVMKDTRLSVISRGRRAPAHWKNFLKKVCLKYTKGKIVKAQKWSIGILVFRKRSQAEEFVNEYGYDEFEMIILRVKTSSRGKAIKELITDSLRRAYILEFVYGRLNIDMLDSCTRLYSPAGTMAYKEVKVLD